MAYSFKLPKRTMIGKDAFGQCESYIRGFGKKAFVVSGKVITKQGTVKLVTDYLIKWNIDFEIFNDIIGEPTDIMIQAGVNAYKNANCDFCICIGGGSPLDSGKAIVAMASLGGNISDYVGKEISGDFDPLVLIPTTAGTGSEATKFTIITDTEHDVKLLLKGDDLLPNLAIIDPTFSITTPKSITAATGMDALTHAIESYTSKKANTLTDTYALSAMKRIFKYLPIAFHDGDNLKAREELAIAAFEAGVCINNASVTLVHGMSRPIGALFHVPHGISNAMLISECLRFAVDGCYDRFATMAKILNLTNNTDDDISASEKFLLALDDICKTCEIPSLEKYGINKDDFFSVIDKMATDAIASGSPSNTRKSLTKDDLISIYKKLWN